MLIVKTILLTLEHQKLQEGYYRFDLLAYHLKMKLNSSYKTPLFEDFDKRRWCKLMATHFRARGGG